MDTDKLYKSKRSGYFRIISEEGPSKQDYCMIEFINTKYRKRARKDHVLEGNVRDDSCIKYARLGEVTGGDSKKFYRLYKRWDCMMHRCYNPNNMNYKYYGAIGVTVCSRWFEFANFIYDVQRLPGYNKFLLNNDDYHLDKDFIQHFTPHNMRMYSPDTCIWMHKKDNIKLSYKLDILFSSGCKIAVLQNGTYSADIVIKGTTVEYGVYETISEIFDNFISLSSCIDKSIFDYPPYCINQKKEICNILIPNVEMCKIINP